MPDALLQLLTESLLLFHVGRQDVRAELGGVADFHHANRQQVGIEHRMLAGFLDAERRVAEILVHQLAGIEGVLPGGLGAVLREGGGTGVLVEERGDDVLDDGEDDVERWLDDLVGAGPLFEIVQVAPGQGGRGR